MRLRAAILLLTAATLPGPSFAKDKPPISLIKTSDWIIRQGQDVCSLEADFGLGSQAVLARLTRYEPGPHFDLTLAGDALKTLQPNLSIRIAFGDNRELVDRNGTAGKLGDGRPVVILGHLAFTASDTAAQGLEGKSESNSIRDADEGQVSAIVFRPRSGRWYRLETGPMAEPMAMMRRCTQALIRSWGYDPAVQERLSRTPTPQGNPGNWLEDKDFPVGASRQGHNGLVYFRLDVDASGAVTACHVLRRTYPDDFGTLTCNLIAQRAKMIPALDAKGNPVKSYFISSVRWSAVP